MNPGEGVDASLNRLNIGFDISGARQSNDRLGKRQRILGAVIDLPGQQILTLFRAFAFGNIDRHAADTDHAAILVDASPRLFRRTSEVSPSGRLMRNSAS